MILTSLSKSYRLHKQQALKQITLCVWLVALCSSKLYSQQSDESCSQTGICCGNDPSPAGVMISHAHARGEWMASYRFMHMRMDGVLANGKLLGETAVLEKYQAYPTYMQMNMHMLMLMYGVSDKLTLMGMVNYNSSYMNMRMLMDGSLHNHGMSASGIGDARMYGMFAPVKEAGRQILCVLGMNLPVGKITIKGGKLNAMYPNQRFPYAMQSGSGTVDLLPCVSYIGQTGQWIYSSQANATVRLGFNQLGYKFGNELGINAWLAYQVANGLSFSVRTEASYSERIIGRDKALDATKEVTANPLNYGGQKAFGFTGITWQLKNGLLAGSKLAFEYGQPVYQNLNGWQMPVTKQINFTCNFAF